MRPITSDARFGSILTYKERRRVARRLVKPDSMYFIKRHGAFFRPEAAGYVDEVLGAGIFNATVAAKYLDVDGLTLHCVADFFSVRPTLLQAYRDGLARIEFALKALEGSDT